MKKLTKPEKAEIQKAVQKAERKTSGEFVTIIARRSDSYFSITVMWAALIALFIPVPLIFIFSFENARIALDIQLIAFVVLFLVFQIEDIKMKLVPKFTKKSRARKLAIEQFLFRGVANTKDNSGVLFFVSLAEHSVEIIADKGINDKVDKDAWQRIVDEFVFNVHNHQMCLGFTTAIEKCGNLMAEHFPIKPGDKNELSDKLIEM